MSKGIVKLGVLLSGGGTTLQNIIDRINAGNLPASVEVVISSRRGVKGLQRAEAAGIPSFSVVRKDFTDTTAYSDAINKILADYDLDLICMAGFMSLYYFPKEFTGKVMNIHPALIPAFCGKGYYGHHVHEAVVESGVKISGCTVHFADDKYDQGPIIIQKPVPVFSEDTPDNVAARVFEAECEAYPEAIKLFAEGRLKIEGRKVVIRDLGSGD